MGSTHLTAGEFQQRYGYNKEEPNGNYKNKNYRDRKSTRLNSSHT